jgi:hypothetical protein
VEVKKSIHKPMHLLFHAPIHQDNH